MNVGSDWVARSKRNRLWLETPSHLHSYTRPYSPLNSFHKFNVASHFSLKKWGWELYSRFTANMFPSQWLNHATITPNGFCLYSLPLSYPSSPCSSSYSSSSIYPRCHWDILLDRQLTINTVDRWFPLTVMRLNLRKCPFISRYRIKCLSQVCITSHQPTQIPFCNTIWCSNKVRINSQFTSTHAKPFHNAVLHQVFKPGKQ